MQELQTKPNSNPVDCSHWSPSLSSFLYNIEKWGAPYFSVNSSGNISVRPNGLNTLSTHEEIDLQKVVKKVSDNKLSARKLAFNVIVLEQVEELDLVIDLSTKLRISPVIGLRAKLRTKHGGHFGSTSDGIGEATQIYYELVHLGACMQFIDVGDGLGIDYDGSKSSNSNVSVGYGLKEYASTVVQIIQQFKEVSMNIKQLAIVDELYDMVSKATDFWAIRQLFPIVPIHCLNQKPTVKGILLHLTCDSDGKINRFIGGESSLPLHELRGDDNHRESIGEQYYLGMFLAEAYDEALGGSHNLLGNPSVVQVSKSIEPEGFVVTNAMPR
ncbi:hypothetical protein CRYUN_Cryun29cG0027000 [Craigia yunnanensis]